MSFVCWDTEDNSKELAAAIKAGKKGVSMFDKKITQIAAITSEGEHWYSKGNVEAFIKWLSKRKEKHFYALNMQYDLGAMFANALDALDTTLVGSRMIRAKWGNKDFLDVFNIWPMSVKKLGKAFGLEKLETESMSTDKAYVFRDVEIIREAMLFAWNFCQPIGVDNLPPTLGGLCVKLWKAWGGENCHDSTELSRQALFGGRVELFKAHSDTDEVVWTDLNSLYPSVMLRKFPGPLEDCGTELKKWGVVDVTVKVKKSDLTVLPFRQDTGRILYPHGIIRGTWTVHELREAEKHGAQIQKVHQTYGTDEHQIPYGTFVNRLYQARLASNSEAEKLFFKLLMNNLYGRLGSSGKITRTVWQTEKNRYDGKPFGDKVLTEYQMPLTEETNWSHAAYVTAYGRLELLKYMRLVGTERLIYGDTDSVIFDGKKLPFETGSKLGQMKVVECCSGCRSTWVNNGKDSCCDSPGRKPLAIWPNCYTYAPKMYQAGNVSKAKGVPARLAKDFIEKGHAEYDLPYKFREAVAFYDRGNTKKLAVWHSVQKFRRTGYDRKFLKDNRFLPCKVVSP